MKNLQNNFLTKGFIGKKTEDFKILLLSSPAFLNLLEDQNCITTPQLTYALIDHKQQFKIMVKIFQDFNQKILGAVDMALYRIFLRSLLV